MIYSCNGFVLFNPVNPNNLEWYSSKPWFGTYHTGL